MRRRTPTWLGALQPPLACFKLLITPVRTQTAPTATLHTHASNLPLNGADPVAKSITDSLAEDYVLKALGVADPQPWAYGFVNAIFAARAAIVRYCLWPRFWTSSSVVSSASGRLQRTRYLSEPWSVKEIVWSKLLTFFGLGKITNMPGTEFLSEGYLPAELGPNEFRAPAALHDVAKQAALLDEYAKRDVAVELFAPLLLLDVGCSDLVTASHL